MKNNTITYDELVEAALTSGETQGRILEYLNILNQLRPKAKAIAFKNQTKEWKKHEEKAWSEVQSSFDELKQLIDELKMKVDGGAI